MFVVRVILLSPIVAFTSIYLYLVVYCLFLFFFYITSLQQRMLSTEC